MRNTPSTWKMNWPHLLPLLLLLLPSSQALDYSDLESLGVSCSERDSCQHMSRLSDPPTYEDRNCECDRGCEIYKDCCIDHARVVTGRRYSQVRAMPCIPYSGVDHVGAFMLNKCRRDYNTSSEVIQFCESSNNISDPLVRVPVTDAANRITYSSRYCAECNNARPEDLSPWMIRVSCESLIQIHNVSDAYIISNLIYDADTNRWGVNHWDDETESTEFYSCEIIFDMPEYLASDVRLCRHGAISTCPPTWRRRVIKRMCQSYTAIVYARNRVYRNPHCALCNDVSVDSMMCARDISSRKKQPVSFALLLDVNRSDGDIVGMTQEATPSCGANQKYDPFANRCRSLKCALPGMIRRNGRCVRN